MMKSYLDLQERLATERAEQKFKDAQENQVSVLVAKIDIPQGTVISGNDLEAKSVPGNMFIEGAVSSLDRIAGMVVVSDIAKGEQLTLSKLTRPRKSGDLAAVTPVGKRAIAISVDSLSSLGGMIKPGDYVDVIATIPISVPTLDGKTVNQMGMAPLFQNVLVIAVGRETGITRPEEDRYSQPKEPAMSGQLTLALTPQEASLIAFVQEQSKIKLVLRSPTDAKIELVKPASWDTLFQYLMPQEESTSDEVKSYVEIYRGLRKEKVPLINKD
jgi:pilus assembly protein CpaB